MAVDGFASTRSGVKNTARSTSGRAEHAMMVTATGMMVATADNVMASDAVLMVVMMMVMLMTTSTSNRTRTCGGRIASPLAAVRVVEQ